MRKKNYTHLHLRNHTYYVRVALPKSLWNIVKKKEMCYTLNTKDYLTATHLLKKEIFKIELLYEYVLGGEEKCLSIRAFKNNEKRTVYERQKGICPKCKKHFDIKEMEADHISASVIRF